MKEASGAITLSRFLISFLLVAVTASGSVVAGENEVVLDYSGKPVKANAPYYLRIRDFNSSYISRFINTRGSTCPEKPAFSVGIRAFVILNPERVIFVLSSDLVRVSTELNIRILGRGICRNSGFWRVADSSLQTKREVVLTGSKSSIDSTFTIKKTSDGFYMFAFGSADKSTDVDADEMIGRIFRLILSNNSTLAVSFYPAN